MVISSGFTMIDKDHHVYTKSPKMKFIAKSSYPNDLLIVGNDIELLSKAKDLVIILL